MTPQPPDAPQKRPSKIIDRLAPTPSVADLAPILAKLRSCACNISLDGSQVQRLGEHAFQALVVMHHTQSDRGDRFAIKNPSEALTLGAARFGYPALLSSKDPS